MRFFTTSTKPRKLLTQAALALAVALIAAPCAYADEGAVDEVQAWSGGEASIGLVYEVAELPAQTTVPKAAGSTSAGAAKPVSTNRGAGIPKTGDELGQMAAGIAAASVAGALLVMIGLWGRRWTNG